MSKNTDFAADHLRRKPAACIVCLVLGCLLNGCGCGQEILITGTQDLQSGWEDETCISDEYEYSADAQKAAGDADRSDYVYAQKAAGDADRSDSVYTQKAAGDADRSDSIYTQNAAGDVDGSYPAGVQNPSVPCEEKQGPEDAQTEEIIVYVCGAVNSPGVFHLRPGARIYEAIDQAGGFRADADSEFLNLAEPLTDGGKITVLTMEESAELAEAGIYSPAGASGQTGLSGGAGAAGPGNTLAGGSASGDNSADGKALVNLNSASQEELMTLPGIGESKAAAIIRYREENGPFLSPQDLTNISGIKNATYAGLKDMICI